MALEIPKEIHFSQLETGRLCYPTEPTENTVPGSTTTKYTMDTMMYVVDTHLGRIPIPVNVRFPKIKARIVEIADQKTGTSSFSAVMNLEPQNPDHLKLFAILKAIHSLTLQRVTTHQSYFDLFPMNTRAPENVEARQRVCEIQPPIKELAKVQIDKNTKMEKVGQPPSLFLKFKNGKTTLLHGFTGSPLNWKKMSGSVVEIDEPLICFSGLYRGSSPSCQCYLATGQVVAKIDKVNTDYEKKKIEERLKTVDKELIEKMTAALADFEGGESSGTSPQDAAQPGGQVQYVAPGNLPGMGQPGVQPQYGQPLDQFAMFNNGVQQNNLPARG